MLDGVWAYSTVGLSNNPLLAPQSGKQVHLELVLLDRATGRDEALAAIVAQLACVAVDQQRAFLRGEVVNPAGGAFLGTAIQALYVAPPVYLPETFAEHRVCPSMTVVFAWLVPITKAEAGFIQLRGWSEFEDLLVQADPNLLDLARESVVSER